MRLGFSTCNKPISQHVSPLAGKTTNRRAVCREIHKSGSEGGGIEANRCFLPLYLLANSKTTPNVNAFTYVAYLHQHNEGAIRQMGEPKPLDGGANPQRHSYLEAT
jgi:hypothetical protein